jgi:phage terminase large subunit-like protein
MTERSKLIGSRLRPYRCSHDPHSTEDVISKAEREAQIRFFDESVSVRLDDKFTGVIVVVMQRLAIDDLSGHLLEIGGWEHLKLPGVAHEHERIVFPVSGFVHEREPGELLWPEREGPEQIKERKRLLGDRGYAGQYQQEPVPLGGVVFKSEWIRYYRSLPRFTRLLFSYDDAHKTGRENDCSVFTVWGVGEDNRGYLLEVWREKEELPTLKRMMAALIISWRHTAECWNTILSAILVEDASSGVSIIQEFKEPVPIDDKVKTILLSRLHYQGPTVERLDPRVTPPIMPVKVDRDKLARAEAVTPMVERGDVLLPDPSVYDAPWLAEYEHELLSFIGIHDAHDDQVDATTQLLNYVRGLGSFNVMNFWRQKAEETDLISRRICPNCGRPIDLQNEDYDRSGERFLHVTCPS